MSDLLSTKSNEELIRIGQTICRGREWRWVAFWAYNIHRRFRGCLKSREVWDEMDRLIRVECDWHKGRDLFDQIRQITLSMEEPERQTPDYPYLLLGEAAAKCISNASWSPGLFDVHAPWRVPFLAFEIARLLEDNDQAQWLHHHFSSLALNRYSDRPEKE
ncbi:MAG: hypothetical protein U1G07_23475 [Verrucomicrobiota bacterium]